MSGGPGSRVTGPPLFRLYEPGELRADGYPAEWHAEIKHLVREQAGYRCVRCFHPYRNGEHGSGEWSRCDWRCSHAGPVRVRNILAEDWVETEESLDEWVDGLDRAVVASDLTSSLAPPVFVEAAWRILTVHHLDGNKGNCRWWNLAALCQRCHLTIQGRVLMARVWPWEHSEWFKPYVAGFYAQSYLGEDLTRDEVEARLDELLSLERAP